MKKKCFFVLGWIGKLGFPLFILSLLYFVVSFISQLGSSKNNLSFYLSHVPFMLMFLSLACISPFVTEIIVCNDYGISATTLKTELLCIKRENIKDIGIISKGLFRWIYISDKILEEKEKNNLNISNRKGSFIRMIYNDKLYELLKTFSQNKEINV